MTAIFLFKHVFPRGCILLTATILMSSSIKAQNTAEIDDHLKFREANTSFGETENYEAALENYLSIESTRGSSPNLAFNIASCYYKTSQLGECRLYLERAKLMDPLNPDIQNNLRVILKKLNLEEPPVSGFNEIATKLNANQWYWLGFSAILIPLLLRLLNRTQKAIAGRPIRTSNSNFVFLCFMLCMGAVFLFLSHRNASLSNYGIVTAHEATLRQSPFEQSEPTASIQEGRKIQIIKRHENYFLCIDKASSIRGWISDENFSAIVD